MAILDGQERNKLIEILEQKEFAQSPRESIALLRSAGLDPTVIPKIDFSGNAHSRISSMIDYFNGIKRHALETFLNYTKSEVDEMEAQYFDSILEKYHISPIATLPSVNKEVSKKEADEFYESVIGENTLRDISFLLLGLEASKSVCYVESMVGTKVKTGTAFMIAEDIMITANHVIPSIEALNSSKWYFNYQNDIDGSLEKSEVYLANVNGLFHASPREMLDYTVGEVKGSPGSKYGILKLNPTGVKMGDRVNIIQHPLNSPKQISIQNNFVKYLDNRKLRYDTTTMHGSSGAPVFNDEWDVIGLHHRGANLRERTNQSSYLGNEAIRISAILNDMPADIRLKILD